MSDRIFWPLVGIFALLAVLLGTLACDVGFAPEPYRRPRLFSGSCDEIICHEPDLKTTQVHPDANEPRDLEVVTCLWKCTPWDTELGTKVTISWRRWLGKDEGPASCYGGPKIEISDGICL